MDCGGKAKPSRRFSCARNLSGFKKPLVRSKAVSRPATRNLPPQSMTRVFQAEFFYSSQVTLATKPSPLSEDDDEHEGEEDSLLPFFGVSNTVVS
jgi:hypothetical protein